MTAKSDQSKEKTQETPIVLFYSHSRGPQRCFSQFYPASFRAPLPDIVMKRCQGNEKSEHTSIREWNCNEQFMHACKAMLFADYQILELICNEKSPAKVKQLGRRVNNFDVKTWVTVSSEVVYLANRYKFSQNEELKQVLVQTGTAILAEASPSDCIWGIGLAENHPDSRDPSKWQGHNLLGKALMRVRCELVQKK